MLQLGNLTHNSGRALLDGTGDHARCSGSYLTGIQVKQEHGRRARPASRATRSSRSASASHALRVARARYRRRAPGGRLRLGLLVRLHEQPGLAQRDATPAAGPRSTRTLFERLFGAGRALSPEEPRAGRAYRRSILDYVTGDTQAAAGQPRAHRRAQARRVPVLDSRGGAPAREGRVTWAAASTPAWPSRTGYRRISPTTSR